jgi:hypothetical protein
MLPGIDFDDYVKPYFDSSANEVGFRIGVPILAHEIQKQPSVRPKWTDYDQMELHGFRLRSVTQGGLHIDFSFRRKQFIDFIGGRTKSGETNCDGIVIVKPYVTNDHRVAVNQPVVINENCTSSGFGLEQILDHLVTTMSFIITAGAERTGLFDMLIGIGSVPYNLSAIFSDPIFVSNPIEKDILLKKHFPYVKEIWKLEEDQNTVHLSDIRYDPKGVWFIFSYPQWVEDTVRAIVGKAEALEPNPLLHVSFLTILLPS